MDAKRFNILLGEDDIFDVKVVERILSDMNFSGKYTRLSYGQEVIDWTLKQNQYKNAKHQTPDLILLDIGLPGVNGIDVLRFLRTSDDAKGIPIIICSGSSSQKDYYECINLGCNAYIQKAEDLTFFSTTIKHFVNGWMQISKQTFI